MEFSMKYVIWAKDNEQYSFTIFVKNIPQQDDAKMKLKKGKLCIEHASEIVIKSIYDDLYSYGISPDDTYTITSLKSRILLSTLPVTWSGKYKTASSGAKPKEDSQPYRSFLNDKVLKELHQQSINLDVSSVPFIRKTTNLEVIVDSREPSTIQDLISLSPIQDFRVGALEIGDILIRDKETNDTLIIERKTSLDLYNSTVSNHLHSQAERLHDYRHAILSAGSKCRIMWFVEAQNEGQNILYNSFPQVKQVDGLINYLTGILDQHVIHTYSSNHTAYLAIKIAQGFFEEQLKYSVNTARTKANRKKAPVENSVQQDHRVTLSARGGSELLAQIPGINRKVAQTIHDSNLTIAKLCLMDIEKLCEIDGIGKKSAEKIRAALNGED